MSYPYPNNNGGNSSLPGSTFGNPYGSTGSSSSSYPNQGILPGGCVPPPPIGTG